MNHRTTLKDIAREANVSVTAASLVLNNRPTRISSEKRQLIIDTARQLQYVPNQSARSLVTNRSMLLALLVPDIENMFFASLAKALEDVSSAEGYSLIVANSDDVQSNELTMLRQLQARSIDGLYLIPSAQSMSDPKPLQQSVESLTFPTILTDRHVADRWCDSVGSDNFAGGRLAAQTLAHAGHTRIGCIFQRATSVADARKEGFVSGLDEAGLQLDPKLDLEGNYRFSGGYRAADRIIDSGATAVFCANDLMALGFLQRMHERGLRCPQDCSIIGYDNSASHFGLGSQLTTLDQNINALAQECHTVMMDRLQQEPTQKRNKSKTGKDGGTAAHRQNRERARHSFRSKASRPWLDDPYARLVKPQLVESGTVAPPKAA